MRTIKISLLLMFIFIVSICSVTMVGIIVLS